MVLRPDKIKVIIFDLGGVIIDLDTEATINAFSRLGNKSQAEISKLYTEANFFKEYETGRISDNEFRAHLNNALEISATDKQLDQAWNLMLGDIDIKRVKMLESLSKQYQLFVMSNTNHIHIKAFDQIFARLGTGRLFKEYFEKVYFSQVIGQRKPNAAAWTIILDEYRLDPEEVLFIDDRLGNIDAAASLGMQVFQNKNVNDWLGIC